MPQKKGKAILIDADVVSHFISGGQIFLLPQVFESQVYILDKVYAELEMWKSKKKQVDNLINMNLIKRIDFPNERHEIVKEYYRIKNKLFKGDGESACMAVARYSDRIIASSNLKDIKDYCEEFDLQYLTTMDFICKAYRTNMLTEDECNKFINNVLKAGSKLPVTNMKDWDCKELTI